MPAEAAAVRQTQRAPKRCLACTKRKQRCDGNVPCSYCVTRNIGSTCRRETVIVKGRLVPGVDSDSSLASTSTPEIYSPQPDDALSQIRSLQRENSELRQRLAALSPKASTNSPTSPGPSLSPQTDAAEANARRAPSNDLTRMATRLGLLNFDQLQEGSEYEVLDADGMLTTSSIAPPLSTIKPSQSLSTQLVRFALDELGWVISIVPCTFHIQHDHLWQIPSFDFEQLAVSRPAWTSLYLAILSCGLVYVRSERANLWGVPPEYKWSLARAWFDAAIKIMSDGSLCLLKPNLVFLQTFCVLTLVTQPFDCSTLHDTLLAAMLRHAYALRLNKLRDNPSRSLACEIGRRIWAFLSNRECLYVTEGCSFSLQMCGEARPFEVFLNINDEALLTATAAIPAQPLPLSQPTKVSYLTAQTRLSAFVTDFNRHQGIPTFDAVFMYDATLLHLLDDMPFFHPHAATQPGDPAWLPTARHVLALSIPQKRLLLHRHYFALSATDATYMPSRSVSIESALAILAERRVHDFPFDDKLDTLNHALPAAIVLLLDALYPPPGSAASSDAVRQRCAEVEELVAPLRAAAVRHSTVDLSRRLAMLDELLQSTMNDLAAKAASADNVVESALSRSGDPEIQFSAMLEELGFDSLLADSGNAWTLDPLQSFTAQAGPSSYLGDGASWLPDF